MQGPHDWSAVEKLFTPDCEETEIAAFHCQQAVEKTLKGFLVYRKIDFERIHDLGRLLDYCAGADQDFESLRDAVEPLTLYAVAGRCRIGPARRTRCMELRHGAPASRRVALTDAGSTPQRTQRRRLKADR